MEPVTITIAGKEFSVPVRYAEGHVLTAGEASALNQTYHENIRNNKAKAVKEGSIDQDGITEYANSYQFGVRALGGSEPTDPVESETRKLIKAALNAKLKEANKTFDKEQMAAAIDAVLASPKADPFRAKAKQIVDLRKASDSDAIGDLLAA